MAKKEKNPYAIKMNPEQLQLYFYFKKRGGSVAVKKGKGSYNRKKLKMEKGWQEMTISELKKYIEFAAPDLDVVVLDRKTYDRLMQKAMTLNAISDKLRIASKLVDKAMK